MLTASASGLYLFGAQWPPPPIPLFTLRRAPRDAQRKPQGRVVRYSFLVRNFHSLLHPGLSRRTNIAISLINDSEDQRMISSEPLEPNHPITHQMGRRKQL